MIKKACAALTIAGALTIGLSLPSYANPGPGHSFACAPGQQGNSAPGFKPAACNHK